MTHGPPAFAASWRKLAGRLPIALVSILLTLLLQQSVVAIDYIDVAHHWSFDNDYTDPMGGVTGIPNGGVTLTTHNPAAGAHCADFHSLNARIIIDAAVSSITTIDWSFSACVNPRSENLSPLPRIISTYLDGSPSFDAGINISDTNQLDYSVAGLTTSDVAFLSLDPSTGPANWQHVVLSSTQGVVSLFVDGNLVSGPTFHGIPSATAMCLGNIPSQLGNRTWDGLIDEVTIFSRGLGPTEVQQLYQAPSLVTNLLLLPDCNSNMIPDADDISAGTSADCNGNGIPDTCDVLSGFSPDTNSNQVPDECETFRRTDCNGDSALNPPVSG